jgi:transposase
VQKEGMPILTAAAAFGFSRPAFYQAQKHFEQGGLASLLPKPRGPKEAHKLNPEVMAFIGQELSENPSLHAPALAEMLKEQFGLSVHPRSIERALKRRQKKHPK